MCIRDRTVWATRADQVDLRGPNPHDLARSQAAWQHRRPYRTPSATLRSRWNQAPAAARARGHAGNQRLHQRWQVFTDRKKRPVVANVAVARELAGWCWSLATLDDTGAAC